MSLKTVSAKIQTLLAIGIIVMLTLAGGAYFIQQLKNKNTELARLSFELRYWVVHSLFLETQSLAENDEANLKGAQEATAAIDSIILEANQLSNRADERLSIASLQERQTEHQKIFGSLISNRKQTVESRMDFETMNRNLQQTAVDIINAIDQEESIAMMTGIDMHPNVLSTRELMRDLLIAHGGLISNYQALLVLNDEDSYTQSRSPLLEKLALFTKNISIVQNVDSVQEYEGSINAILGMLKNNLALEDQLVQLWREARDGTMKMRQVVAQLQDQAGELANRTQQMAEHFETIGSRILIGFLAGGILLFLVAGFLFARNIGQSLRRIAADLKQATEQVVTGATELASSSQALSSGASQQAAAIEETSSSLEEMASMTRQNADNAGTAKSKMAEAVQVVRNVDQHMSELSGSIEEITRSSEETGKIIKNIDEIAFQTNLLALNAAVEAARAGEAGAGFAVVAEEVRNLAMKAAEAAKTTTELIDKTVISVRKGNDLTLATRKAFEENIVISERVSELVEEIAVASREQAQGIDEVNQAVAEMDKVVQQVAATAEESAAASEEMNSQSLEMEGFVSGLTAIVSGNGKEGRNGQKRLKESNKFMGKPAAIAAGGYANKVMAGSKLDTAPQRQTGSTNWSMEEVKNPKQVLHLEDGDFKDF